MRWEVEKRDLLSCWNRVHCSQVHDREVLVEVVLKARRAMALQGAVGGLIALSKMCY